MNFLTLMIHVAKLLPQKAFLIYLSSHSVEHAHFLMPWMALEKILRFPPTGLYLGTTDWNDVQWVIEESQLSGV